MVTQVALFAYLDKLGIIYTLHRHKPVFTVSESEQAKLNLQAAGTKNLFLKDRKKQYWLITASHETVIDLKETARAFGVGGFSFASPDSLLHYLGVTPGSVTPLGLLQDTQVVVHFVLDATLVKCPYVGVHPLENNATLSLAPAELMSFVAATGHKPHVFDFINKCIA